MSLRDTLKAVSDKAAEAASFEADKPRIIAQWQEDVRIFNNQIKGWLKDYEEDGALTISRSVVDCHEEYLGSYQSECMAITAGQYIVLIRPVGRIIFGAVGRIDMYRQGQGAGNATRFIHSKNGENTLWLIRKPQVIRQGLAVMARPSEFEPLTKERFEAALDEALN